MNGQLTRARDAVLRYVCCRSPCEVLDLVAIVECKAGLCPRHGRTIVAMLVGARVIEKAPDGRIRPGPRFKAPPDEAETGLHLATGGVRGVS